MMKAISLVINPLLMPTVIFTVIFYFVPEAAKPFNSEQAPELLIAIVLTTFVIPMASIGTLRFTSTITSFWLENRKERILPLAFMTTFYGLTAYMFISKIKVNDYFAVILITMTSMLLVVTLVTFYWKISIQSTALSGLVGFIGGLFLKIPSAALLYPLVVSILLAGIVMSARLALNTQTPEHIFGGTMVGLLMGAGSILCFT